VNDSDNFLVANQTSGKSYHVIHKTHLFGRVLCQKLQWHSEMSKLHRELIYHHVVNNFEFL